MIACFPDPYPDELFYSLCARFAERVRYASAACVTQDLFGQPGVSAVVDFPSHLGDFLQRLPPGHAYTLDGLIDNHTLVPLQSPFLAPERLAALRAGMAGSHGSGLTRRVGIYTVGQVPAPCWLRYCPVCAVEDRLQVGESYWHRLPQLPGVLVCPRHAVWLETSTVRTRHASDHIAFFAAERVLAADLARPLDLQARTAQILLRIAQDSAWLLAQHELHAGPAALQRRYRPLLTTAGFAGYRGTLDRAGLHGAFRTFYSDVLLVRLACALPTDRPGSWLSDLVIHPTARQAPLHHLLLIQFLEYSVAQFFALGEPAPPFGVGPWPCLNPASDHYQQLRIAQCPVGIYQHGGCRPIGTFACVCGFVYACIGPDTIPEDRARFSLVRAYGPVWEAALCRWWADPTMRLYVIAARLHVCRESVKIQAARLGLPFPRPGDPGRLVPRVTPPQEIPPARLVAPAIDTDRATWLALREQSPDRPGEARRAAAPAVYRRLMQYDYVWLQAHKPPRHPPAPYSRGTRLDWVARDRQLAEAVFRAAAALSTRPGPPARVSRAAVIRAVEEPARLRDSLARLPQTAQALANVLESREAYAVRRIAWVTAGYAQAGYCPTRSQLLTRVGAHYLLGVPAIAQAIEESLRTLQALGAGEPAHLR